MSTPEFKETSSHGVLSVEQIMSSETSTFSPQRYQSLNEFGELVESDTPSHSSVSYSVVTGHTTEIADPVEAERATMRANQDQIEAKFLDYATRANALVEVGPDGKERVRDGFKDEHRMLAVEARGLQRALDYQRLRDGERLAKIAAEHGAHIAEQTAAVELAEAPLPPPTGNAVTDARNEFEARGKLSEATYTALEGVGLSRRIVDTYIRQAARE